MSSKLVRSDTKKVNHTPAFSRAASDDPLGSLAYMILSAFGVSLTTIMEICDKILADNNIPIAMMCIAAGVQIRGNVTYVGRDFSNIRETYPQLVIEGDRDTGDVFNFGALHAVGHALCHLSRDSIATAVIKKSGSCITKESVNQTDAGSINGEIADGWAPEDVALFRQWSSATGSSKAAAITGIFDSIKPKAKAFSTTISASASASASSSIPINLNKGSQGPKAP